MEELMVHPQEVAMNKFTLDAKLVEVEKQHAKTQIQQSHF